MKHATFRVSRSADPTVFNAIDGTQRYTACGCLVGACDCGEGPPEIDTEAILNPPSGIDAGLAHRQAESRRAVPAKSDALRRTHFNGVPSGIETALSAK